MIALRDNPMRNDQGYSESERIVQDDIQRRQKPRQSMSDVVAMLGRAGGNAPLPKGGQGQGGGKERREVQVGYKINAFGHVDTAVSTFYCDFKIFAWWKDRKLMGEQPKAVDWKRAGLFNPELTIANDHNLQSTFEGRKLVDAANGWVKWSKYFRGTLFIYMDLRFFPFDYQQLYIAIRPHKEAISAAELRIKSECHVIDYQERHEWDTVGHKTETYATARGNSTTGKVYSELRLIIMVRRFSNWYLVNIAMFMFAMVTMSWAVFAMSPEDSGSRMEVALSLVLSIMASKFVIGEKMPKTSYQTLADLYITASFCFLYLVVIENVSASQVARWQGLEVAEAFDFAALIFTASLYFLLHAWLAFRLWFHHKAFLAWKATAMPYTTMPEPPTLLCTNGESQPIQNAQRVLTKRWQGGWGGGGVRRWWTVGNEGGGSGAGDGRDEGRRH